MSAEVKKADILVIGGGMAGASAAYFMADDANVVLLEREVLPGYHTTGRSAALYTKYYGNDAIRAITRASETFFRSPPDGFCDGHLLSPRGMLFLATDALEEILTSEGAEIVKQGGSVEYLTPEEAQEIAPYLRKDAISKAFFEPSPEDMDVAAILQGFLRGLRAKGGSILTDAEVQALSRKDGVWRLETRAGTFEAPIVINAAGAWCDEIATLAGARQIGLVPKRRTAFTFDIDPALWDDKWPMTFLADESWYMKPDAGRMLGSPADETPSAPTDAQPEELDLAIAADRIMSFTSFEIRRFASTWAGLRSFVADKTPVVGFDGELDGFFWLAGQGGYGIQTSPMMGQIAASLALTNALPASVLEEGLDPLALSPNRAGLR